MTEAVVRRPVDAIVWREDLYPRFEPDPATIQRYAESLDKLPPIQVNQRDELIDGYHRWTAHKKAGAEDIAVHVRPTASDAEVLRLAIETNATHGMQLSQDDKRRLALKLYDGNKAELAALLSVNERTVARWTESIDAARREEQQQRIRDLWLAVHTQQEIGETVGLSQPQTAAATKDLSVLDKWQKPIKVAAEYAEESWQPPLYNLWSFGKKTNETGHFGNSEQRILDNLLYLYTEPFDIVVDPFAGGGSTIDVCKRRLRRYWAADRLPIPERRDIRKADIADGPPRLPWSDVSLVYLDPPYWRQAKDQYSKDAEDLANMPLEDFYTSLVGYVKATAGKMRTGSHIALLIQPTQWLADDRQVVDHVVDLITKVGNGRLLYEQRIICPYQTEQYNAQQVEWAKANRALLTLNRELIVWQVRG